MQEKLQILVYIIETLKMYLDFGNKFDFNLNGN